MRGNFNKIKEITQCNTNAPDILAMQEIWSPHPWQHNLNNYHQLEAIERKGRSVNKGGGVGFFVKAYLNYTVLEKNISPDLELIVIKAENNLIGNVYRPPKGDFNNAIQIIKNLLQKYYNIRNTGTTMLIGGDFNVNFMNMQHQHTQDICNTMAEYGMGNIINTATRITENSETQIDAIFCNNSSVHGHTVITEISDHLGITATINKAKLKRNKTSTWTHDISKSNLETLKKYLQNFNWNSVKYSKNPSKTFHEIINMLFKLTCPKIKRNINKNIHPIMPWMTRGLLNSRRRKLHIYKEGIKSKDLTHYKTYRCVYNKTIKAAKLNLLEQKINEKSGNSRDIWQLTNNFINKTKQKQEEIIKVHYRGSDITDKKTICDTFNNFFCNIGEVLANDLENSQEEIETLNSPIEQFNFTQTNQEEITKVIARMKPKSSTGYDNISNYIVKMISQEISEPLTYVINHAIQTYIKQIKL